MRGWIEISSRNICAKVEVEWSSTEFYLSAGKGQRRRKIWGKIGFELKEMRAKCDGEELV